MSLRETEGLFKSHGDVETNLKFDIHQLLRNPFAELYFKLHRTKDLPSRELHRFQTDNLIYYQS